MFKDRFNVVQEGNLNVVPSEIKKKMVSKHLDPIYILSYNNFYNEIVSYFVSPFRYSVLVRVSYINTASASEWKSLGNQIGVINNGSYSIDKLYDVIIKRLRASQAIYNYQDGDIISFQLLIYQLEYTKIVVEKKLFNVRSLGDSKDLINVSHTVKGLNKTLPLTYDSSNFGVLLSIYYDDNNNKIGFISKDGYKINFIELVNKHIIDSSKKLQHFSSNTQFYYRSVDNNFYIVVVEPNGSSQSISVYTTDGINILNMVDKKLDKNGFSRQIGNVLAYIDNTGIYKKDIILNLAPIKPNTVKGHLASSRIPDWMVGTIDLETYQESIHEAKIYAMGFYTKNDLKIFYINESLDSDNIIISCLDCLLVEKYHNYTFFVHNLGGFDGIFILRILIRLKKLYPNVYDYDVDFRDGKILYLDVSKKVGKKKFRIKIHDSLLMLNAKLDVLSKTFDTNIKKGFFPYSFIKKNTLFYIGKKPDISFYGNGITIDQYNDIPSLDWSVEKETRKYLEGDLISLYQVIDKFKYQVFIDYHTHITKSLTISGLAMNIFLNKFYKDNIPLINKKSVYNDIKNSYYGGITEVYIPYGEDLYYYDVNSLYPYCGLMPMPGLSCIYLDNINKDISECTDFFGFYNCIIEAPENYIGYLPVRSDEEITMPTGYISGWYFSEELKFAHEQGCKIHVLSGYQFNKEYNVFKDYIEHFYDIKSTTKSSVTKMIAKSLLNNLIGRFGLNIDKSVTRLISYDEFQELLQYKHISNVIFIDDEVLVTHSKDVSMEICEEHNVDYKQALINDIKFSKHSNISERQYNSTSIVIASAVTAYARIFMQKIKLGILAKGGKIYYTDTDSIVTDKELDKSLVGSNIGQFKLVDKIKEGYFISSKTYGFINYDNKVVIVAKGINDKNLSSNQSDLSNLSEREEKLFKYNDLIKLYHEDNVETVRRVSQKNYSSGFVTINDSSPITLHGDAYSKRIKLYDNNNLWINTKPIHRKYHTDLKYLNNSIKDYLNIIIIIILFISIIYLKISNIVVVEFLLGDILETVFEDTHSDYVDISFNDKPKSNYIKTKMDLYKYKSDFCKLNSTNDSESVSEYNTNKFKILREIIRKHSDDNLSLLSKTQNELDCLKIKVSYYEKIISEYDNIHRNTLKDLHLVKDMLKRNSI